jgi:hypothetical protein
VVSEELLDQSVDQVSALGLTSMENIANFLTNVGEKASNAKEVVRSLGSQRSSFNRGQLDIMSPFVREGDSDVLSFHEIALRISADSDRTADIISGMRVDETGDDGGAKSFNEFLADSLGFSGEHGAEFIGDESVNVLVVKNSVLFSSSDQKSADPALETSRVRVDAIGIFSLSEIEASLAECLNSSVFDGGFDTFSETEGGDWGIGHQEDEEESDI